MEVSDIVAIVACLLFGYVIVSFLLGGLTRRRAPRRDVEAPQPPALVDEASAEGATDAQTGHDPERRADEAPR